MIEILDQGMLISFNMSSMNGAATASPAQPVGQPTGFTLYKAKHYRARRPRAAPAAVGAPAPVQAPAPALAAQPPAPGNIVVSGPAAHTSAANAWRVEDGLHSQHERNFDWLPYFPGMITYIAVPNDRTILTGPMSGCWLVLFSMNGARYFAHIGTDSNSKATSELVKTNWKIAVGSRKIQPIKAFSPSQTITFTGNVMGALKRDGTLAGLSFDSVGVDKKVAQIRSAQGQPNVPPHF